MQRLAELEQRELPEPPALRKLIGPSFIILGLGLGSGELILWPYLVSRFGLGIIWGAVLGVTLQFFMNMEIERYTLINGESIFVGFARKWRGLPVWFLLSTFLPWMWPGIITTAAAVLGSPLGWVQTQYLAMGLLVLIGIILTLGPVLYKIQESLQKWFIYLGAPFIFGLAIVLAKAHDWTALVQGVMGRGEGYWWLPVGIPMASFLAALAYSGAGGNLNLAQSYYVREKGYGMGKFMGRITSVLTGKSEQMKLTGVTFAPDSENMSRFKRWWRLINMEHGLIFLVVGLITILLLALLAYTTTYGTVSGIEGIGFVAEEAAIIGRQLFPFLGSLFLIVVAVMLFATQLSVLDATSRILAENLLLVQTKWQEQHLRGLFYVCLWIQIITGVMVLALGFKQPLALLTLSAVLNAVAMLVHCGLTLWLNTTALPVGLRPNWWRRAMLGGAVLVFSGLSGYTVMSIFR